MKIYLVGGAVRDELLGRSVSERDWVVVGANPEKLLQLGYQPVGKDFPVFLHPKTHEEYALARIERKTGAGYTGFACYFSEEVTLEEDLKRRDLTINAMAKSESGEIIDPYGGQADLRDRVLRHVSSAFVEDPVRILRVARFAARFGDFHVHSDTVALMTAMRQTNELDALVAERVWRELERAIEEPFPLQFFSVLQSCQAMAKLFPELGTISDNANPHNHFAALARAVELSAEGPVRFAALLHDLAQASIKKLSKRLHIPVIYHGLAQLVAGWCVDYGRLPTLDAAYWLQLLENTDAFRRPQRFQQFLLACAATLPDSKIAMTYNQSLEAALQLAKKIDIAPLLASGLSGQALGEALSRARKAVIADYLLTDK